MKILLLHQRTIKIRVDGHARMKSQCFYGLIDATLGRNYLPEWLPALWSTLNAQPTFSSTGIQDESFNQLAPPKERYQAHSIEEMNATVTLYTHIKSHLRDTTLLLQTEVFLVIKIPAQRILLGGHLINS